MIHGIGKERHAKSRASVPRGDEETVVAHESRKTLSLGVESVRGRVRRGPANRDSAKEIQFAAVEEAQPVKQSARPSYYCDHSRVTS